jgi:hypothetical protein
MASERQIAANRRNAKKSSGPRSAAGKDRASNNAYRHGLFSRRARAAVAEETEAFARKIADRTSGAIALEHARIVAEADNELALIRDAKRALIDRTDIFGDFKTPPLFPTDPSKDPWLMSPAQERRFLLAKAKDLLTPEQKEEAARSAAIKRVLSELTKLSLYEKRTAARRDRTIRKLMKIKQKAITKLNLRFKYVNIIL